MSNMQQLIKDKIVVISGAARGICFSIADNILDEGAKHVIILDIKHEKGIEAANILNSKYGCGKAEFIKTDVSQNLDLDKTFDTIIKKYKTVDILVNGAGVLNERDVKKTFEVNAIGLIENSLKFFRHMRKDKGGNGGTILNISSVYGYMVDQNYPIYKGTKYAVMGFSKTLGHAANYEMTGVKVVVLCPGRTETDILLEIEEHEDFKAVENNVLRESQTPQDVANAAIELIKKVPSGTAWNIIGAKPIVEV